MLSLLVVSAASTPSLIPMPNHVEWRSGSFAFSRSTKIETEGADDSFIRRVREALGKPAGAGEKTEIVLQRRFGLPAEGYTLDVDSQKVRISGSTDAGLYYGIQTLGQLNQGGQIPACHIEDAPRFKWRGLLLDVSRHFYDGRYVRKFIDDMSTYKLNTFHWHLTDDGGWRVEMKQYPELTKVGAWRKEQGVEWNYLDLWFPGRDSGQKLYGGYYSQREVREIVKYAQERNVTIVPEIEMPGHSLAAAASHPELQCDVPPSVMAAWLKDSNSQAPTMVCPGKDSTLEFEKHVLDEVMDLFPSKFIHIGGDEVDKSLWHQCRACQARMKALGLKNEDELQSWFIHQMDAYVASKGRRLIGWDEILEGGLAPGATVMSWRGIEGGIAAAKSGHDVVMSPTSHCYFDYSYETIPTSKVYSYEAVPTELTGDQQRRVLGGQGNIWTEWLSDRNEIESMTYPRALALSETLWTEPEHKSWTDFERRLNGQYDRMANRDIRFQLGTPRLDPDVLNTAVAPSWSAPQSNIPGVSIVQEGAIVRNGMLAPQGKDVKVFYQLSNGRRGEATTARVVNLHPATNFDEDGLLRMVIPWKGLNTPMPKDFDGGRAEKVSTTTLDGVPADKASGVLFNGGLVVEHAGRYTIGLGSDDGAVLYLDGQRIMDTDGAHAYYERTATIDLQPGIYRMHLCYFDAGGARRLQLFWVPPGGSRESITLFRR